MFKLLLMLLLSINIFAKDFGESESVYAKVEALVVEELPSLKKSINKLRDKEINIGFYTTQGYEVAKEKLNLRIRQELINEERVNIVSEDYDEFGKLLEKQNNSKYEDVRLVGQLKKTKYLLKIDFNNIEYERNFYLKEELRGIIALELINLSTGSVVYGSYKPMSIVDKVEAKVPLIASGIIFLIGIIASIATRKYYTLQIMGAVIVAVSVLNFYYFMFI